MFSGLFDIQITENVTNGLQSMDIYRLKEDTTFAEQIGATLDVSERLKLELGLIRLTELANADQLLFWGRVQTLSKPYYISMSVDYKSHYQFPHKRFFWSQSDKEFEQMPQLLPEHKDKVNSLNLTPLTGNPTTVLVSVTSGEENQEQKKQEQQQPPEDSDEQNVKKQEPKNLTELDRLSVIVRAIQNDCHAVPIGAYRLNEEHELRENTGFSGLSLQSSYQLKNYQLFRAPQSSEKRELVNQANCIFRNDFLDPIQGSKVWSIQWDCSRRDITIRNLIWPGYVSYHRAQTNIFGGIYMGDGIKKVDLAFLL